MQPPLNTDVRIGVREYVSAYIVIVRSVKRNGAFRDAAAIYPIRVAGEGKFLRFSRGPRAQEDGTIINEAEVALIARDRVSSLRGSSEFATAGFYPKERATRPSCAEQCASACLSASLSLSLSAVLSSPSPENPVATVAMFTAARRVKSNGCIVSRCSAKRTRRREEEIKPRAGDPSRREGSKGTRGWPTSKKKRRTSGGGVTDGESHEHARAVIRETSARLAEQQPLLR